MAYKVNFKEVETVGLESSPVAEALAGLRANEARYFWNKYKFEYLTYPASEKQEEVALFEQILLEERDLKFSAKLLEVAIYESDELYWPEFYYEDGMVLNLLYERSVRKARNRNVRSALNFPLGWKSLKNLKESLNLRANAQN